MYVIDQGNPWCVGLGELPARDERPLIMPAHVDRWPVTLVYRRNAEQSLVLTGHSGMLCAFCFDYVHPYEAGFVLFTDSLPDDLGLWITQANMAPPRIFGTIRELRCNTRRLPGHEEYDVLPSCVGAHGSCGLQVVQALADWRK